MKILYSVLFFLLAAMFYIMYFTDKGRSDCYMMGRLCFSSLYYSSSSEDHLTLKFNHIDYSLRDGEYWMNWLGCRDIKEELVICSAQQLISPNREYFKYCDGRMDIVQYPKDHWRLKYYLITLQSENNPPYKIIEVDKQYVIYNLNLEKWQKRQSINYEQELLCGG